MSTFLYNNALLDIATGGVVLSGVSYAAMLVTDSYTPNKQTDHFRSDVLAQAGAEVSGSSGYTAGGLAVSMTPSLNASLNQLVLTFSTPMWASASITARGCVVYVSRGGAANLDNLVAYVDFGMDVTSVNDTFTVIFSTPLIIQN